MKEIVARALAKRIQDGETIGVGSGSTAEAAVSAIGRRVAEEGLRVTGVPTSHRTAMFASQAGVSILSPLSDVKISWAFDGADEVDPRFRLIKGNGAAMLNEKILGVRAEKFVVIVTENKLVDSLGKNFPIPVEVIPAAHAYVREQLLKLGARDVTIRAAERKYGPVITENGNLVLDARFDSIPDTLEREINTIVGVVENGLFFNLTDELLVAREDGVWSRTLVDGKVQEELIEKP